MAKRDENPHLSPQERLFCRRYVNNGFDAKEAATFAEYSEKNAASQGCKMLTRGRVMMHVKELLDRKMKVKEIDKNYVLEGLAEMREMDFADIIDRETGLFKLIHDWPLAWRRNITGIDLGAIAELANPNTGEVRRAQIIKKIKLPDKVKAYELMGKHVDVQAWDKEQEVKTVINNVMPVPTSNSVEDWEKDAQAQQEEVLKSGK